MEKVGFRTVNRVKKSDRHGDCYKAYKRMVYTENGKYYCHLENKLVELKNGHTYYEET